ncbi:brachyurin-like [Cloeon dipterum]|uniref:brachyurin-like n=1 Tax=Cloeon dipterum TaxID=197152 RepID=UPI0032207857
MDGNNYIKGCCGKHSSISATITMKAVNVCLLLVAIAQAHAADWAQVQPVYRDRPTFRVASHSKIIGGNIATPGQFPYQVGLFIDGSGFCGGSLISDTVILTAAHCVDGIRIFEAHLGAHDIYDMNEPNRVIVISTDGVAHENFNPATIDNDIAIVRLGFPVGGFGISPVRLPAFSLVNETFSGDRVRVSGWGRTSDATSGVSPELKYVDVSVIDNSQCQAYYGNIINESKICVDTNGGTEGTCHGDSGGPLVIQESDGEYTEIGIVSFGSVDGCESGFPAAFTRVTEYLEWLEINAGVALRP